MVDLFPDTLKASRFPVIVEGSVSYDEKSRVNCLMRIKKRLIKRFPELKEPKQVSYRMELWNTFEELQDRIGELGKTKGGLPILLFLTKDGQ